MDDQVVPETGTHASPVTVGATRGPDGTWWVMVTHQGAAMSFTYGIPADQADRAADDYAAAIHAAAAEARRAAAGLVIANATGVHPNGNRVVRRHAAR